MWIFLLQGIGYGFSAAVQPGPFQAYIISQSLDHGWRRTLPAALAPLVSDGPIIALALFVLAQIPVWLERCLHLAGGLFVLYLAYGTFRRWTAFESAPQASESTAATSLWRAALMNALNPGPYVYWSLVTGPILVTGWREGPALGIAFLGGFYGAIVLTLAATIVLFAAARDLGPKVNRTALGISAYALTGFGLYQLWLGVGGLLSR